MYADIHVNNLLLAISLWDGEEYPQAWHKFARSVLIASDGLLPLVLHTEQRYHIEKIANAHDTADQQHHLWSTRRETATNVAKQAARLMHIHTIPEWSLNTVGDFAITAAAESCMTIRDADYPTRLRRFTAAVAEAFANARQASVAVEVKRTSGCPAELFLRLDAIRQEASDAAYRSMHTKLLAVLRGEELAV